MKRKQLAVSSTTAGANDDDEDDDAARFHLNDRRGALDVLYDYAL